MGYNPCGWGFFCVHLKGALNQGFEVSPVGSVVAKRVSLASVDSVVLSHGHYDHSGGLLTFAKEHPQVKIYLQESAGDAYYSQKEYGEKYIGIDPEILQLPNLCFVKQDIIIDDELSIFTGIKGRRLWPEGNRRLHRKQGEEYIQDDFSHEQYLVIRDEDGNYGLFSGCAHNGILNIIDRFREIYHTDPAIVVSGFHMMQQAYSGKDIENIRKTGEELKQMDTVFYTGHCTGEVAFDVLKECMGESLHEIRELCAEKDRK